MKITSEELIKALKANPDITDTFLIGCKPNAVFDLPHPIISPDKLIKFMIDKSVTQQKSEK